jgi:hypothetical protein
VPFGRPAVLGGPGHERLDDLGVTPDMVTWWNGRNIRLEASSAKGVIPASEVPTYRERLRPVRIGSNPINRGGTAPVDLRPGLHRSENFGVVPFREPQPSAPDVAGDTRPIRPVKSRLGVAIVGELAAGGKPAGGPDLDGGLPHDDGDCRKPATEQLVELWRLGPGGFGTSGQLLGRPDLEPLYRGKLALLPLRQGGVVGYGGLGTCSGE